MRDWKTIDEVTGWEILLGFLRGAAMPLIVGGPFAWLILENIETVRAWTDPFFEALR